VELEYSDGVAKSSVRKQDRYDEREKYKNSRDFEPNQERNENQDN
jgi:hypothetical protein